jgi:hypothetical protein
MPKMSLEANTKRSIFHQSDTRIRGDVFCSFLAMVNELQRRMVGPTAVG